MKIENTKMVMLL